MRMHTKELDEPCYPICANCGGQGVESVRDVGWDVKTQSWSIVKDSNYSYCFGTVGGDSSCGETNLYWIPVNNLVGPPQQHKYNVDIKYSSKYWVKACSEEDAKARVKELEKSIRPQFNSAVIEMTKENNDG